MKRALYLFRDGERLGPFWPHWRGVGALIDRAKVAGWRVRSVPVHPSRAPRRRYVRRPVEVQPLLQDGF